MLTIENLHVKVDGKQILNGVDLDVKAGEVHAIMGPNGVAFRLGSPNKAIIAAGIASVLGVEQAYKS